MPMICPVPKDDTYHLPAGRYQAVLIGARVKPNPSPNRSDQQQIRLLFAVHIPAIRDKNPMAGRSFNLDLKRGSDLRTFLDSWLGTDYTTSHSSIDFEKLIGHSADLSLTHHQNHSFDRPFVNIEAIHPAGTLSLTETVEPIIGMPAAETDYRRVA